MRNTETYNTLQKPEILFPTMKPLDLPKTEKQEAVSYTHLTLPTTSRV